MTRPYEMRLRDILDILRRRRRFIIEVVAVAMALGAILSVAQRPVYRASSAITADKTSPVILLDQPGLAGQNVATPIGIASPDVPTLVALAKSETVHDQAVARLAAIMGARAARAILKTMRVQPFWNTEIVRITVDDSAPAVAAEAVNAVTSSLIDMDLNARRRWAREMRESIQQQIGIADPRLRAAEDALVAFKAQYGDVPLSERTVMNLNQLAQLEAQRVDVRLRQQEARARIDAARSRLARQAQISPTQWKPSPLINTLQTELTNEEIELSGLRQQFTPKHPAVINVAAKIAETKQRLDAESTHSLQIDQYGVDPVYQQLIQQLRQDEVATAAFEARDRALSNAIAQYEGTIRELPIHDIQQVRLARDVKEAEAIHQLLTDKLQQAFVAEGSIGSVVRVVDVAKPPIAPPRPRFLGVLLGALVGLLVGVGGALLKEQVEDPVKSVEHGEQALGTPVLGAIPRISPEDGLDSGDTPGRRAPGLWDSLSRGRAPSAGRLVAAARWRSAFAESFRYLRTNLLYLHKEPLRTLLVTSPGSGDGKDIVAANLAIALAQAGLRVWLVDCDLRKPALAQAPAFQNLGHEGRAGVAEILSGGVPEELFVRQTAVANLWFLPAGTPPDNPAELLGSQRMRAFLQQDRDDVDVMVLAAPPILPVTDAAVLAPAVEGVLLVVHIGTTPREAAGRARQQLEAVGAKVVGTVVTGAPMEGLGRYFNHYARYYGTEPHGSWYFGPGHQEAPGAAAAASRFNILRRALRRWR